MFIILTRKFVKIIHETIFFHYNMFNIFTVSTNDIN